MKFIEEITPYIERIKLHQDGGRITNIETLREIRDIHFTHIRSKDFNEPSNLGCGNCVKQMINQLVGKIDRDSKKKGLTSFDKKETIRDGKKMKFPKQEPVERIIEEYNITINEEEDTSKMKWGEFKKYCTSKGLKVKGKKRVQLEEELNNL